MFGAILGLDIGLEHRGGSETVPARGGPAPQKPMAPVFEFKAELNYLSAAAGLGLGAALGILLGGFVERRLAHRFGSRGGNAAVVLVAALGGMLLGAAVGALAGATTEIAVGPSFSRLDRDVDLVVLIAAALGGTVVGALAGRGIIGTFCAAGPTRSPRLPAVS
jgi:hypothetical protein